METEEIIKGKAFDKNCPICRQKTEKEMTPKPGKTFTLKNETSKKLLFLAYEQGYAQYQKDIQTARRCLQFLFRNRMPGCNNIMCLNESCPLNRKYMTK